jgi:hypothetical protein
MLNHTQKNYVKKFVQKHLQFEVLYFGHEIQQIGADAKL